MAATRSTSLRTLIRAASRDCTGPLDGSARTTPCRPPRGIPLGYPSPCGPSMTASISGLVRLIRLRAPSVVRVFVVYANSRAPLLLRCCPDGPESLRRLWRGRLRQIASEPGGIRTHRPRDQSNARSGRGCPLTAGFTLNPGRTDRPDNRGRVPALLPALLPERPRSARTDWPHDAESRSPVPGPGPCQPNCPRLTHTSPHGTSSRPRARLRGWRIATRNRLTDTGVDLETAGAVVRRLGPRGCVVADARPGRPGQAGRRRGIASPGPEPGP